MISKGKSKEQTNIPHSPHPSSPTLYHPLVAVHSAKTIAGGLLCDWRRTRGGSLVEKGGSCILETCSVLVPVPVVHLPRPVHFDLKLPLGFVIKTQRSVRIASVLQRFLEVSRLANVVVTIGTLLLDRTVGWVRKRAGS